MTYPQAIRWLQGQIPHAVEVQFPGERGLERTRELLKLLGEPQNQLRVVHVAGTSGKGSTAYLIATLLQVHGFRVGLSLKPYIFDVRERFQVNGRFVAKPTVAAAIERVRRAAAQLRDQATYFEVVTALMFLLFAESKLDYVVVETGVGGTYDATNVIDRADKLAVLTRIGLDHEHILGSTLTSIAAQKAGIIGRSQHGIVLKQTASINQVFRRRAKSQQAKLTLIDVNRQSKVLQSTPKGTSFSYAGPELGSVKLNLSLLGTYQRENAVIALSAVEYLSAHDSWHVRRRSVQAAFGSASLPAHFEVRSVNNSTVIIDGAHNPQKLRAFLTSLRVYFPHEPLHFLVSFKLRKYTRTLLRMIEREAASVVVTNFTAVQDSPIRSEDCRTVVNRAASSTTRAVPDAGQALSVALRTGGILVITGSIYFCATMMPHLDRLELHRT